MKKSLILLVALFATTISLQAGIKERLAKRLPSINKLKEALVIGENNKGYLEVKGKITAADKKIIDEENSDRKKIYYMLAKRTGVTVDIVQKRRAEAIAKKSKKGIWLQKPDGSWYKK